VIAVAVHKEIQKTYKHQYKYWDKSTGRRFPQKNKLRYFMKYSEIQRKILSYYPLCCRRALDRKNKTGRSWGEGEVEAGYALHEIISDSYTSIEKIMLLTMTLILCAGREPKIANENIRKDIDTLISENNIDKLCATLSSDDASLLKEDLKLLKII
jgi:hypothetical protein